jgi:hypothetical protein
MSGNGAEGCSSLLLDLVMKIDVELEAPVIEVGEVDGGFLRMIPITGGRFKGPRLEGKVLPGGFDWNTYLGGGVSKVLARYALRTDDGALISVTNEGWLADGETGSTLRTVPRFETGDERYSFLRHRIFLGSLEVFPDAQGRVPRVRIGVYSIDPSPVSSDIR